MSERKRILLVEVGANAYVVKPLDFGQLLRALGDVGLLWAASQPLPVSTEGRP